MRVHTTPHAHTLHHMHTHYTTCTPMHTHTCTLHRMRAHTTPHAHTRAHTLHHVHTNAHTHMHTHTHAHYTTCAHTCTHTTPHAHTHTCTHTRAHTHMHTTPHMHTHTQTHTHAHTYTHTHNTHTHTHTHMHTTHTHTQHTGGLTYVMTLIQAHPTASTMESTGIVNYEEIGMLHLTFSNLSSFSLISHKRHLLYIVMLECYVLAHCFSYCEISPPEHKVVVETVVLDCAVVLIEIVLYINKFKLLFILFAALWCNQCT